QARSVPLTVASRTCDYCREPIHRDALKCPHCGKWRKDAAEERNRFLGYVVGAVVGIFASSFGFDYGYQHSERSAAPLSFEKSEIEWHERVVTKSQGQKDPFFGRVIPGTDQKTSIEFSP